MIAPQRRIYTKKRVKESNVVRGATLLSTNSSVISDISSPSSDGRKSSRGSALRKKHANLENTRLIELFESTVGELAVT